VSTLLPDVVHFDIVSSEAQSAGAQQGAATNSSSRDVTRLASSPPMTGGVAGFSDLLPDESSIVTSHDSPNSPPIGRHHKPCLNKPGC